MGSHIVMSANTSWNLVKFRLSLIRELQAHGYDITALAPPDEWTAQLRQEGCHFIPLKMDNKGTNPLADGALLLRYMQVLRRERPDAYVSFTIKPNIYGALAARSCGIPALNNVSGLGTAFIRENWVTQVAKWLYRRAFAHSHTVFFQNDHDRQLMVGYGLVSADQTALVPGSGVDLKRFTPAQDIAGERTGGPRFLLIGRLVYDKGIREYVEAAKRIRARWPEARCALLGYLDVKNRTAVPREQVERWVDDGAIEYLGPAEDVRPHVAAADCVVMPSYREGISRTLIEAAAMAKPLIATDVPGCREIVESGHNGLLCRAKDPEDLASKMAEMIQMTPSERQAMGRAGRRKMENEFDERIVFRAYIERLASVTQQPSIDVASDGAEPSVP